MAGKLTEKQKRFVNNYICSLNATEAAKLAGYSEKTAMEQGYQLLHKPSVQQAIKEQMGAREKRTLITADKVLNEIAKIAFCNGTEFAKVVEKTGYKPIFDEEGKKIGEEPYTYQTVEIINTNDIDDDKKAAISCIKDTKFGISVETCDKVKALELLGKHLKLFTDKIDVDAKTTNLNVDVSDPNDRKAIIDELIRRKTGSISNPNG